MGFNRRTFFKVAGLGSMSLTAACGSEPEKTLYSLVQAQKDMVTGQATWYASTCRESIDLNPVICSSKRAVIVDARIILKPD